MESAAISGARWVVGKALSPLSDGLVEAWAASSELGPNIEAVKMELLYARAMLNNARGRQLDNPDLTELLQKLRAIAYDAEDVLDELDYFRIQDNLEGTFETVDRACVHNLVRDARNTAKAAAKQLECTSCFSAARGVGDPYEPEDGGASRLGLLCGAWPCGGADGESCKCVRQLTTRARSTAHAVGKRLLCSSLLPVDDDGGGDQHSSTSRNRKQIICGVCSCTCMAPQKKHAPETPKLDFDRVDVSRRMKHIVEQLQPTCAKVSTILNLELFCSSRSIASDTSTSRPITTSKIIESEFYGRKNEKKTILENITKGEYFHEGLTVLPIVGPGGIGKTTLTQHIYNSSEVQEHFQITRWICVSLDFNVYRLTNEIATSLPKADDEQNGTDSDLQNLDQLQKLIEKRLKNKRFLLVLDDIWKYGDEDEWKRLLVPFTNGQVKGNIVLVTTRFHEVAEMVRTTDKSIQLEGLKPEEFWGFFEACVFSETKQQFKDNDHLLPIGEKIVEKLKGSPLAAKTVGRLLRNNLTPDHWTRVLESKEWESQTGDHDIMSALKLSYDYLPFHLQQCFSYSALFPEDYRFDSEELIRFWIGLDILRPGHATKRIEDVGLSYLNELVNYGFFKRVIHGTDTSYVIHDLLHDLALKVSSQECLHIASSSSRPIEIPPSIYHLSISMSTANSEDGTIEENFRKEFGKVRNRLKSENLHTLMLFGEYDANFAGTFCDLFKDAKSLRVVHLSTMSHPVEYILHNFSKLVHLRYLRLVSPWAPYGSEVHLPRSLSRFYHLMVLDIERWNGAFSLPRDMTNLVKLRHFLVPYDTLHSNIPNVGKLRYLQELRRFQVKKESNGFELRELGQLSELGGSLGIYNLENVQVNETHEAKLLYKNRLQKLTLNWSKYRSNVDRDKEDQVLEGLRPHDSLRELCIDGHGGFTCPTWLGTKLSVKALEALHLDGVAWQTFPPLGELSLFDDEHGEKLCGCITGPSFQKLKRLVLVGLPKFRKWVAKEACPMFFSLLEELVVQDCVELTELPFSFYTCHPLEGDGNATWFPKLQVLHIDKCPKLLSLPHIPYSHTLCDVEISHPQTGLEILEYSNKTSSLRIEGNEALHRLDDKVLAFHNLAQLQELKIRKCPPLAAEHLQMLTSLETLTIEDSSNVFMPLERSSDVKWQLPVSHLKIDSCGASGKELTQLLSHLPKLSELDLYNCEKIKGLSVDAEQQPVSLPSSSSVKMEDRELGHQRHLMAEEVEGDEVVVELVVEEEGLLLLPAHLSNSLRELKISYCKELSLVEKDGEGWIRALRSLQRLRIRNCPKLLSANSSSSCCPFPSSLQHLELRGRVEGMETLEPLSNLTSLTRLYIVGCGEDLRGEGLWPLLTRGQLTQLFVWGTPKFFAVGWGLRDEDQGQQLLLRELRTDDIAGVLAAPICSLLSASLTNWFCGNKEVERFTKEQEATLHLLTSLEELQFFQCDKLQCLPAGLHRLTNLKILQIWFCPALRSLPKQGLPTSLQKLTINKCSALRSLPKQGLPSSLQELTINKCSALRSLPKQGLPSSLQQLTIKDCPALRSLPKEGLPTSLQKLTIDDCPALRSLPKQGLPSSLQELDVKYCKNEELKQRCRKLTGTIPKIRL